MGKIKFILPIFVLVVCANAGNAYNYGKGDPQAQMPAGNSNQQEQSSVERNHFELNIDKEILKDVEEKRADYKGLMDGTYDMDMMAQPIMRPMVSMDSIYVTTKYITTIMFPGDYAVIQAIPSFSSVHFNYSENVITIKPSASFTEGNIFVSMTDGKQNRILTINMRKFTRSLASRNKNKGLYGKNTAFVSTMYTYIDKPNVDNITILEAYTTLFGENCGSKFTRDGAFDVFTYEDIPYYVIRDDKFGTLEFDGVNYRIANEYRAFAEESIEGNNQ